MADEDAIRRCVREELEQNLVQRTRNLIRSSAASSARDLERNLTSNNQDNRSLSLTAFSSTNPRPRVGGNTTITNYSQPVAVKRPTSVPGHSLRFKRSKPVKVKTVPKTVWMLDKPSEEHFGINDGVYDEYSITEDMVLIKGEIDIMSNHTEEDIRREITAVFNKKFPCLTIHDFEFVKRERNVISSPVVKDGHQWDFEHVKHLCGNGRLYVRLSSDLEDIQFTEAATSSEDNSSSLPMDTANLPSTSTASFVSPPCTSNADSDNNETREDGLQESYLLPRENSAQTIDEQVASISTVFPSFSQGIIRRAVTTQGTTEAAANYLLTISRSAQTTNSDDSELPEGFSDTGEQTLEDSKPQDLSTILRQLRSKMHQRGMKEKLKVDYSDQVMDVYSFYKSLDFDPLVPISVFIKGQPAIDTGGVLRQVFSEVFFSLSNNEVIKHLFIGEPLRKVPFFSSELVVNGFFEVLGKMISHSLVQGGPGFPYLAPTIYWYLATGNLQTALCRMSCLDVTSPELQKYIDQISKASDDELSEINSEAEFTQLMCEAGETRILTASNQLDILQSLMLHDILVKRKSLLDQFRKGLSILGLLDAMEHHPSLFEECFVNQGGSNGDDLLKYIRFEDNQNVNEERIYQMLKNFLRNSTDDEVKAFRKFVTGSPSSHLPRHIYVSCHSSDSIFVSTCLFELKLPMQFESYTAFDMAMKSVIKGSSFTTG